MSNVPTSGLMIGPAEENAAGLPGPEDQSELGADDLADASEEEGPLLAPEDLEEGFCKDDIYAIYLKQQYFAQNPKIAKAKVKEPRSSKSHSRRRGRSRERGVSASVEREVQAMYYARSRLVGEMAPYFGGIPVVANSRVEYWMRYFKTSGRHAFLKWLVRGESVREVVYPVLRAQGLPQELFFLAMVESGFSNVAYSSARATGTWQFMSSTAKLYGLRIDHFVDERRDPVKSTLAAAQFLRDLYEEFGDWYLAMAAYNAGPGKIKRAIRSTGSNNFWTIAESKAIAVETRHYVPKVLAALIMASNPKAYGFDIKGNPTDVLPVNTVQVKTPASIDEIATKLGLPLHVVQSWNPELIRNVTPPRREAGYNLRLPESLASRFAEIEPNLSAVEVKEVHMHKVRTGETLARIAQKYRVKIAQILSINPRLKPSRLKVGVEIAVPVPSVITKRRTPDAV